MDRSRAGNPGRRGVSVLRINPNSEISERDGVDYRRAPRAGVQSLEGPRAAGGRNAADDAVPNRPDLSDASSFPLRPGKGTVRNLKRGGRVGPKKDDDSDDIVGVPPARGPIPRSQGLRGAIASTTRREMMDRDYPAQPDKNFKRGGKVAAKAKARRKAK